MYATKQTFDGQKASIGRIVVVKLDGEIYAGLVTGINMDDEPEIRFFRSQDQTSSGVNILASVLHFASPKTEEDIESLPDGSWFWPPRV